MKLFLIIPSLGTGGAERVGVLLANGFCQRGHEVAVFANLQMRQDYKLEEGIERYDIGKGRNKIHKWLNTIMTLRHFSKKGKPDVVIGIMSLCSLMGYIATMGTNIPVVETIHSSFEKPSYAPMSLWEKFYKFYLSRMYKIVTVLTEADRQVISNNSRMVLMPNPLSLEPMIEIQHKRGNTILAAGRLDDWHYKGFDVLIRAFGKLVQGSTFKVQNEGWKLQIAGTGSEESLSYLKQLCKENGVEDSVEFLGFRKDVEKLYRDSSIFVLSSRYEGFGLVLIEAMSQGCACIACDYKGRQREIICPEGQGSKFFLRNAAKASLRAERNVQSSNCQFEACDNGILCEPDNVEALAEVMAKMITDDEYRERVRKNAIERSKYYSIDNTMDRWESLLKQVTKTC